MRLLQLLFQAGLRGQLHLTISDFLVLKAKTLASLFTTYRK